MTPLIVELDGALLKSDLFYETIFDQLTSVVSCYRILACALVKGRAALEDYLASATHLDYGKLPYDPIVLEFIRAKRAQGSQVFLATAGEIKHATAISSQLGLFDGELALGSREKASGPRGAERLVARFGEKGFDYIGSNGTGLAIWTAAATCYVVRAASHHLARLTALNFSVTELEKPRATSVGSWLKAFRVHQYAKNFLVFVPTLTAHRFDLRSIAAASLAFICFSACASAAYLLNDLLDLRSDRLHPTKRLRPFASGEIPIAQCFAVVPGLLLFSSVTALAVSLKFAIVLIGYFVLTSAYSLVIKRRVLIDVVVLALLYAIRVIGGAVAIDVVVSEWLFVFSLFIFTSLALVKRYVSLAVRLDAGLGDPIHRDYRLSDRNIVAALAAASGINAVTIFAIYLASPDSTEHYRRPEILWLYCPMLLYWIARILIKAHRRELDDDPLVFTLRDPLSRYMVLFMIAITLAAI